MDAIQSCPAVWGPILFFFVLGYVVGALTWHRLWPGIWNRLPPWLGGPKDAS